MSDEVTIADIVEATKSDIAELVLNGVVPHTITDFGDLHAYTDANMIAHRLVDRYQQQTGMDWIDFIPAVQDEVHDWICSGALHQLPRPPQGLGDRPGSRTTPREKDSEMRVTSGDPATHGLAGGER